jgi:hypothetical protein
VRRPKTVAQQFAPRRLVPPQQPPPPKPVAKKLWARLETPMQTVIETGCAEAGRRDPHHHAAWVALVDGALSQIAYLEQAAHKDGVTLVIILDILHVLAYLWKAAHALFPREDSQGGQWVTRTIGHLLDGQVASVVRSLRRSATVQGLSPTQREPVEQCATSLRNHAAYLTYPCYVAKGYPIATGVIAGACRHLVKERMDITGARWGREGGEAVLKLRALYINGDFDAYWACHEKQEYLRNHPAKFLEKGKAHPRLQLLPGGKREGWPSMQPVTQLTG